MTSCDGHTRQRDIGHHLTVRDCWKTSKLFQGERNRVAKEQKNKAIWR